MVQFWGGRSQNTAVRGGAASIGTYDLDPARFPTITVQGNHFADNVATVNGGAVWGYKGYFSVEDNVFEGNHTLSGDGGAYNAQMKGGALQIVRNLFINNVADDQGGALLVGTSPELGAKPVTISENVMVNNAAYARGGGGAGSGGGIAFGGGDGFIDHNTIAYNIGATNSPYYGGGISFASTQVEYVAVTYNIIAFNGSSGIACVDGATPAIESNLFWMNASGNVYSPDGSCTGSWALTSILADPLFCDPAGDIYSVAQGSPALGPGGPYGAFGTPGCPDSAGTSQLTRR